MIQSAIEVVESSVVGQQQHGDTVFPAVYANPISDTTLDAACAWVSGQRSELISRASACGTVLFRGFPVRTADDFDRFIGAFGLTELHVRRLALERRGA